MSFRGDKTESNKSTFYRADCSNTYSATLPLARTMNGLGSNDEAGMKSLRQNYD